jgi:hypothetical protein
VGNDTDADYNDVNYNDVAYDNDDYDTDVDDTGVGDMRWEMLPRRSIMTGVIMMTWRMIMA